MLGQECEPSEMLGNAENPKFGIAMNYMYLTRCSPLTVVNQYRQILNNRQANNNNIIITNLMKSEVYFLYKIDCSNENVFPNADRNTILNPIT